LEGGSVRGYLPHALVATALVVALPALALVPLAPFDGALDVVLATVLATGVSLALASAGSALWTRTAWSRELAFGDLMLWVWVRRLRVQRQLDDHLTTVARQAGAGERGARELAALRRMAVVLEARDDSSHRHSERVARHAERVGERLGLTPAEIAQLRVAAALHDVGMTRVRRSRLDAGERGGRERADDHARAGAELVAAAGAPEIAEIVRRRGDRFDARCAGSVPRAARILAVADAFESIVAAGGGTSPQARANALDVLVERAGHELDPGVVSAFVDYYSARRSIAAVAVLATAPLRLTRWLAAPAGLGSTVPPLTQGACVAGALAVAGVCLAPPGAGRDAAERPARGVEAAQRGAPTTTTTTTAARAGDGTARRSRRGGPRPAGRARPRQGGSRPQARGAPGPGTARPAPPPPSPGPGAGPREVAAAPRAAGEASGQPPVAPSAPAQPGQDGSPSGPLEQLQAPDLPGPSEIVDPIVDTVEEVLAPLPVEQITDPVQELVRRIGGGGGGGGLLP
jgi:hypothetical protein